MFNDFFSGLQGMLGDSVGPRGKNEKGDVKRVESALDTLGYLDTKKTDGPTGYYGERLKQGIEKLQKDAGLKTDGVLNPDGPTERTILAQASNQSLSKRAPGIKEEWERLKNDPRRNTMTAKEALGPPIKYGGLKIIELGAPIIRRRLPKAFKKPLDVLEIQAGMQAERIKRDYLQSPQAKTKRKLLSLEPTPKTSEHGMRSEFKPQPPVKIDRKTRELLGELTRAPRSSLEEWVRQHYADPKKSRRNK